MILFEDKRIHGATSITLLIGLVIMSIFFMSLYVSDIVEKNSEIYERKQRIAALEERYLSTQNQLKGQQISFGINPSSHFIDSTGFDNDLSKIEDTFTQQDLSYSINNLQTGKQFTKITVTSRGESSNLFDAFIKLNTLNSQINGFQIKNAESKNTDILTFTLVRLSDTMEISSEE